MQGSPPPTLCGDTGTFHLAHLEAGRSGAALAGGNGRLGPRPLPSPAARRARWLPGTENLGWGRPRTWRRGLRAAGQRARRSGSRAPQGAGAGEGCGPGGRATARPGGPRCSAGEVSWPGKVQLCAAIPGMSGGPGGGEPRGRRFPGPREREGGPAGGGGKDEDAGAHPLGRSRGPGGRRGSRSAALAPASRRTVATPGPDSLTTKAAAAGSPGAAGGRTEAGGGGRGRGGAIPGRRRPRCGCVKRAQSWGWFARRLPRPARLPGFWRTWGRFRKFRVSHVFTPLRDRNFPSPQRATKGGRTGVSQPDQRRGGGAGPPVPSRTHRFSLPL